MGKTTFIYALKCPISEKIRYIGKANNPKKRYNNHVCDKNDYHKNRWLNLLKEKGLKPELIIIDEVDYLLWEEYEIKYIKLFKSFGADLVNSNNGGSIGKAYKGTTKTKEQIKKTVESTRLSGGYIHSEERKKHMSEKMKGKKPKNFDSFIGNRKGVKLTQEQKDVLRKINLGKRRITKVIVQYDLNGNFIKEYPSILQACRETGFSRNGISKSLNKKLKAKKYEFRYK